jgi:hypothetical protein
MPLGHPRTQRAALLGHLGDLRRPARAFCRLGTCSEVYPARLAPAVARGPAPAARPARARPGHRVVIGDALVHTTLLPTHTIRALSRRPRPPASLTAQGTDFDFVLEVADGLRKYGFAPIIAA